MIVGLIPTYREGPIAANAVRSLLKCCDVTYVWEGPIIGAPETGPQTELGKLTKDPRVFLKRGAWPGEEGKRNAMLHATRRYPAPVWGVYLDADEVLTDAEYVPDLIWAAEQQHKDTGQVTVSLPLLRQEIDGSCGTLHRIFRLDLLEKHVLSMSQFKFYGQDFVVTLPLVPTWKPGEPVTATNRPPMKGEPSIHHRAYYRPKDRADFRLYKSEVSDFEALEREHLERLGIRPEVPGSVPVPQAAPKLIVASEREAEKAQPSGLLEYVEFDSENFHP